MTSPDTADRIRRALEEIARAWPHMLPTAPAATLQGVIGRNTGAATLPGPVPVTTLDVRAQTRARLAGWCLVVIDDLDLHPSLDGQDAAGMCRFLDTHADHLGRHEAARDVVDELADSARACTRIAYPAHTEPQYVGPCQGCGFDLYRRYGASQVTCSNCGQHEEADDLSARLLEQLKDRLMTPMEMARAVPGLLQVPINPTTLAQWKARGRLVAHGKDSRGRDLFRVGDVLDLVNQQARRTA